MGVPTIIHKHYCESFSFVYNAVQIKHNYNYEVTDDYV